MKPKEPRRIPAVTAVFGDGHIPIVRAGWNQSQHRWDRAMVVRQVSRTFVRQCQSAGYTRLRVGLDGRQKDFTIDELLA